LKGFCLLAGVSSRGKKGSHRVYGKADLLRPIIVPEHNYPLSVNLLLTNLKTLGASKEDLMQFLSKKK
jgi:hypothetical protein